MDRFHYLPIVRAKAVRCAGFVTFGIFFPILGWAQTVKSADTAQAITNRIQKFAIDLLKSGSPVIKYPILTFDGKEKVLEYNLGNIRIVALGLEPEDPYLVVYRVEIHTEALRKLYETKIPRERQFGQILEKGDLVALGAVKDIEGTRNGEDLTERLRLREEEFEKVLGDLDQAVRDLAKKKRLIAKKVGRGLASDTFTVHIVFEPPGGHLKVLTETKYFQCVVLKKCPDGWQWNDVLSDDEPMLGKYYYKADWSDSRATEGEMNINANKTITFRPR